MYKTLLNCDLNGFSNNQNWKISLPDLRARLSFIGLNWFNSPANLTKPLNSFV